MSIWERMKSLFGTSRGFSPMQEAHLMTRGLKRKFPAEPYSFLLQYSLLLTYGHDANSALRHMGIELTPQPCREELILMGAAA